MPKQKATGLGGDTVYFQQCSNARVTEEINLIRAATVRESLLAQLKILIRDVNLQQRVHDDLCILETFILLNEIRNATFQICDAIEKWQDALTKITNPQIFGGDYIGSMSKSQEFLINVKVRRLHHFNIGSGNILMLPMPSAASSDPSKENKVNFKAKKEIFLSPELLVQMQLFAKPSEEKILRFYAMLRKYLTKKAFNQILPFGQWIQNSWKVPSPLSVNPLTNVKSRSGLLSVDLDRSYSQRALELRDKGPLSLEVGTEMSITSAITDSKPIELTGIKSRSTSKSTLLPDVGGKAVYTPNSSSVSTVSLEINTPLPVLSCTDSSSSSRTGSESPLRLLSQADLFSAARSRTQSPLPLQSRTDSFSATRAGSQSHLFAPSRADSFSENQQRDKNQLALMKKAKLQLNTDDAYIKQMQKQFLSKKTSNLVVK